MKKILTILLSVIAVVSTMAMANDTETIERSFTLDKFSYLGISFKDSKSDLVSKGFECIGSECKREDSKSSIQIVYTGDKMQFFATKNYYQHGINCDLNQNQIKEFLISNYDFEYVNQDRSFFGKTIPSSQMGGNIQTTEGKVFINVQCSYNTETNRYYASIRFDLVDIVYEDFKKDFQYQNNTK